jgi:histidinol-phosphate aminotransferase
VRLAGNENNLGHSPLVLDALAAATAGIHRYPDPACTRLRLRLAEKLAVAPNQIVFGDGSFELLSLVAQTFLNPGEEAIVPEPSFRWYKVATWAMDGRVVSVPLRAHRTDLDAILGAVSARSKLVWICNPQNPTGTSLRHGELVTFLKRLPSSILVVLDEAYIEYADAPERPDALLLMSEFPNVVSLRTFSKLYGLAGLRIGYGIGQPQLIAAVDKVRPPINVNHLAQVAALAALDDSAFVRSVLDNNAAAKEAYARVCAELGMTFIPTQANFIMVDTGRDGDEMSNLFLQHGILLRSGVEFGMPTWLRITLGTVADNEKVFAVLRKVADRQTRPAARPSNGSHLDA